MKMHKTDQKPDLRYREIGRLATCHAVHYQLLYEYALSESVQMIRLRGYTK